ncbi:peptidase, family M3 (plasmid) [Alkalihalophilus pseudofirmus OF4]|uniref:Peptidase, family M3 n=1 Tax=Alkalihalophilus pseudofirmus (strain ATCC BAA-2126 / JCM 17055 / OF4) TaxID=398511 RepID=D3G1I3_ALKPO|nr:M3 family metallopeptidase [Alkalihalophilus pseudofirmus]ADC52209.1 peptidase, family M3 [Alkalihalophilus pseudofirmus OF4]
MESFITPTRWNLNNLLQCDSDLEKFKNYISCIKANLLEIEECEKLNPLNESGLNAISQIIKQLESAESFYYCLTTEDVEPSLLTSLYTNISMLKSQARFIVSNFQERIGNMSEKQFSVWSNSINQKVFIEELLMDTQRTSKEEKIISNFARETLGNLEEIYVQARNNLKVKGNIDKDVKEISFAEASSLALSHPEQTNRRFAFRELNQTLKTQAEVFASVYNSMVGLRLKENMVKNTDYLDDSLRLNGISKRALHTMWDTVDTNIHSLSRYLKIKAGEVGKERISWHELMTSSQEVSNEITYSQASKGIIDSLVDIDTNMSEFVKGAIAKGWVDSEQRKTKPPGGFCAPFIPEGESRISLNYDNSIDSARRLAHELGHAWHFKQMKNVPSLFFSDDTFEMTMAETSSIFFETAYIDYVIQNTDDTSLKKAILGAKIERSLNYLMSIRGAFLFEDKFYGNRKKGPLDANQVEELSLQCQEKAYGYSLSEYEPFVWIKYVQFYQANIPFYNYPYSFGFLLSIGLLNLAKRDKQFDQKFQWFLSETGLMPLEQLIHKHFNIEISKPDFWQQSIQSVVEDIEEYNKTL